MPVSRNDAGVLSRSVGENRARRLSRWAPVLIAALLAVGCGAGDNSNSVPSINGGGGGGAATPLPLGSGASTLINGVRSLTSNGSIASGVFTSGYLPGTGAASAPLLTANASPAQVVPGGALLLTVTTPVPVSDILVGVPGQFGFFDVNVAGRNSGAGPQQYPLAISVPATVSSSPFMLTVVTKSAQGAFTAPAAQTIAVNPATQPSQTLEVSLSWNSPVDMDLHLMTPNGSEIGYDNRNGQNGGMLDVDSNANCQIGGLDTEDITWGSAAPAHGVYVVRPDLYSVCGSTSGTFPYVVTIRANGTVSTFLGQFTSSEVDANSTSPTAPSRSHTITFVY